MNILSLSRIGAAVVLGMAGAAHAALINGSFEADAVPGGAPGYIHGTPSGWTLGGNAAVIFSTDYSFVSDGNQAVQLEYFGDTLSQTFATTAGTTYLLKYDLSGYQNALASPLQTTVQGTGLLGFQAVSGTYPSYVTQTLTFTADSGSTTLTFLNAGGLPPGYGTYPHIDNVSVTAVPEPETYAMMLAGLGVMGFIARRRRTS